MTTTKGGGGMGGSAGTSGLVVKWLLYEMDKHKPNYILTSQAFRVGLFLFSFWFL
jgi:hypothetical protein